MENLNECLRLKVITCCQDVKLLSAKCRGDGRMGHKKTLWFHLSTLKGREKVMREFLTPEIQRRKMFQRSESLQQMDYKKGLLNVIMIILFNQPFER